MSDGTPSPSAAPATAAEDYLARFQARTPGSRALYDQARRVTPGGISHNHRYHAPYPIYFTRAKGPRIWDVDGNEYLDLWMAHYDAILGHAPDAVVGKLTDGGADAGGDLDALTSADYPGSGRSVADELTEMIATIGENMGLRRAASLSAEGGVLASYTHAAAAPGLGKIGVLVALKSDGDAEKLTAFGKQLAMHIAATNPQSVAVADLDQAVVEREREVLKEQAIESGKPPEIAEKMVEGRLRKFYEEVVLLEQTFVIDNETKISKAVEAAAADAGAPVEVTGFVRFALGEGIEREESDFASEVAEMTG